MKGCVVDDQERVGSQLFEQELLDPSQHGFVCAVFLKQHRGQPFFAALGHDQVGGLTIVACDTAMHLCAARCPSMGAVAVRGKAAFIPIHDVLAAVSGDPGAELP